MKRLQELIDTSPRLCSTDAQLVLRDAYETMYGIYNHEAEEAQHPLGLVLMHWNEDVISQGPLHERMQQYIDADINKYFHFNFDEWIQQPTYVCNIQVDIAREKLRKEAPLIEEALARINAGSPPK